MLRSAVYVGYDDVCSLEVSCPILRLERAKGRILDSGYVFLGGQSHDGDLFAQSQR